MGVQVRRIYDAPAEDDGVRILVDRLWPRGVAKERLVHDQWMREVAPSTELRKWYGHRAERFGEFRTRYRRELSSEAKAGVVDELRRLAASTGVTLLTATRDVDRSAARVLAEVVEGSAHPER